MKKKLKVQEYLETHSLEQLKEEFGVGYVLYTMDGIVTLCYDQILSKPGDIVNECRGLSLKTSHLYPKATLGETDIVAYPFDRFYNMGQPEAAQIDAASAKYFIKLDGSIIVMSYYPTNGSRNGWNASTKKMYSNPNRLPSGRYFNSVFFEALQEHYPEWQLHLDKKKTYMFELTGPENHVVIEYREPKVTLIGIRNNETLEEEDILKQQYFETPPFYTFNSLEEAWDKAQKEEGLKFEGFVAVDKHFNRVKIKNKDYCIFNRIKDAAQSSPRNLLRVILNEMEDDVIPVLGEHLAGDLNRIKSNLRSLSVKLDTEFEENATTSTRKEYAQAIQAGSGFMAPQMWRFTNKDKSFMDWVRSNGPDYKDHFLNMLLEKLGEK